jgi:phage terminase large subunit-like protein
VSNPIQAWLDSCADLAPDWRRRKALRESPLRFDAFKAIEKANRREFVEAIERLYQHPYFSFEPREDNQVEGDEQEGFINSRSLITVAVGGNGSGKTYCGAQRLAKFLSETPPPTRDTPFWCIANVMPMVCQSCWYQKLREILPAEWVDWPRIQWYREKRGWPYSVPLKPHANGKSWTIEFKSYEMGRESMQAAAIGGAWFTEQFPWEVFQEVLRGCREWMFPGSVWMEFTPIDPEKSMDLREIYEKWCEGDAAYKDWSFHRLNTMEAVAAGHAKQEWFDQFVGSISEEMVATRTRGVFASYEGVIYQTFNPKIHCIDEIDIPPAVMHKRAIDWGASEEHPFAAVWGYKDATGCWWIYDEYLDGSQSKTTNDHIDWIKERHPWPRNNPWYRQTYGDPSRPDLIKTFNVAGIPIAGANNAVYDGIETVRRALKVREGLDEPGIFIYRPNCPNLIRQLTTYRWEKSSGMGVNPKAARPVPLKRNDDLVDALRYLLHSDYNDGLAGASAGRAEAPRRPHVRHRRTR